MTPYQVYQLYQAERPKSRAEIRQADEQLGHMAARGIALRTRAARRMTTCALWLQGGRREPATTRHPRDARSRARAVTRTPMPDENRG